MTAESNIATAIATLKKSRATFPSNEKQNHKTFYARFFPPFEQVMIGRSIRALKQPRRRRRQQKPHKFAYFTMKNSIFARFARAFFIFLTF